MSLTRRYFKYGGTILRAGVAVVALSGAMVVSGCSTSEVLKQGYVLDEDFANPRIAELQVTPDGHVLARNEGDIGCNSFIGSAEEMGANFSRLVETADLTNEETTAFKALYQKRIGRPL